MSEPRNPKDQGIVAEPCNEGGDPLTVAVDIEANLYDMSDVAGVNGSAVDHLEASGFLECVSGEAVLGGEGVVAQAASVVVVVAQAASVAGSWWRGRRSLGCGGVRGSGVRAACSWWLPTQLVWSWVLG